MEYYSNAYQYLKQKKMLSYLEMKTSGDLSWTDKIDPGVSPTQALSSGMKSSEEMAVQEKLGKIRAKLQSGARLTGAEKEYLKKHDPQLYSKVMALEEEEEAYAERLKQSRTRNDAEKPDHRNQKSAGKAGGTGGKYEKGRCCLYAGPSEPDAGGGEEAGICHSAETLAAGAGSEASGNI